VAIFTHSVAWEFWAPLMAKRVFRVQTWHGMPIKHIGYDDEKDPFVKMARLLSLIFPYLDDHLNLVTAGGEADEACYRTAFNVDRHAIIKVGYARNDALLASIQKASETKEKVINVIYMPTFRGVIGSEFKLFSSSGFDFTYYDALCDRLGINFWIKLHPVQLFQRRDLEAIEVCKNIHALQEVEDIYEEMGKFDILVTDFSGIYFDYLITGRPIIMAPINMADYLDKDRSLYYPYEDICPDEPCLSWHEVFNRIEFLCKNIYIPNARYKEMQTRFHANLDDLSACRTVRAIKQRK
jgi:CDP-glycerol glycerophosphotransferase (TagB/SpsB family)